ncbi:hypothetical protein IW150_005324, partial [Coemansia sp. RSA 2607]
IYGGSVQPAATTTTTTTTTAPLFFFDDAHPSTPDSPLKEVFHDSPFDDSLDSSQNEYEESLYMLENATAAAHNLFPAENSGGVFDVAFEHVEPGGSTITGGSGGRAGRLPAYATRVPVSRQSSRSSDSDIDGETDAPDMPSSASPCVLRGDFSLKAAADVQMDVFPHGIPSQGVIKSGLACISASVLFRAPACRPSLPWEGFIVDDVLFVRVPLFAASGAQFRTAVMALLELAEDVLHCASIMIAVPKTPSPISSLSSADAASLVRAFMYAGFDLVSPMLYQPAEEYVLLGYDAM